MTEKPAIAENLDYGDVAGGAPHAPEPDASLADERVFWPDGAQAATARVLTDAADEYGIPQESIVLGDGHFRVPAELAQHVEGKLPGPDSDVEYPNATAAAHEHSADAGGDNGDDNDGVTGDGGVPAKKAAPRKAPAKKAAAPAKS